MSKKIENQPSIHKEKSVFTIHAVCPNCKHDKWMRGEYGDFICCSCGEHSFSEDMSLEVI